MPAAGDRAASTRVPADDVVRYDDTASGVA
jgi:hypothetical protein